MQEFQENVKIASSRNFLLSFLKKNVNILERAVQYQQIERREIDLRFRVLIGHWDRQEQQADGVL